MVACRRDEGPNVEDCSTPAVAGLPDPAAASAAASSTTFSARELQSAFDNAPIGMAVVTPEGVVIGGNGALGRLLGRPADSLVGDTLFAVTHPDDLAEAHASCARMHTGETSVMQVECRFLHLDGTAFWVSVSTSRVPEVPGHPAHLIMHIEDVDDRKALEAALLHRATHDSLTGLANRTALLDRTAHALARAARSRSTTCLFMLDLDGFKAVNDAHGHAAGDAVLQELAHRITAVLRAGDTAARLGGDEFVVLCEELDAAEAERIAERLRAAAAAPFLVHDQAITLTAAVGASTCAGDEHDAVAALRRADLAMYAAKRTARAAPH